MISAEDQKHEHYGSEYDELKEKVQKAETQKTISVDQVRGDTETTFPEEMRNRLCLWSLQQPHGQHTLTLSKFLVNYTVCENLILRQSISKLFHYVQLILLCHIFNILVKLRDIFSSWFQYLYNFINISEISFLITVMIGMFLKII